MQSKILALSHNSCDVRCKFLTLSVTNIMEHRLYSIIQKIFIPVVIEFLITSASPFLKKTHTHAHTHTHMHTLTHTHTHTHTHTYIYIYIYIYVYTPFLCWSKERKQQYFKMNRFTKRFLKIIYFTPTQKLFNESHSKIFSLIFRFVEHLSFLYGFPSAQKLR